MYSIITLLRIFAILTYYSPYLLVRGLQCEKDWLRKLKNNTLPLYFPVLDFDYGIQLSMLGLHVSREYLITVTFLSTGV